MHTQLAHTQLADTHSWHKHSWHTHTHRWHNEPGCTYGGRHGEGYSSVPASSCVTYPLVMYFWMSGKRKRKVGVWLRNSGVSAMHPGYMDVKVTPVDSWKRLCISFTVRMLHSLASLYQGH